MNSKFALGLLLSLSATTLMAQDTMYVKQSTGTIAKYATNTIDSVYFKVNNANPNYVLPTLPNTGVKLPYTVMDTLNGVGIRNGGFGSAAAAHPYNKGEFYALTDRGPNADATGGKYFPTPDYTPRIGHFKLNENGTITQLAAILLKDPYGNPISGLPNPAGFGSTGEIAYDLNGVVLPNDTFGLDSEGLAAMDDGTFWVSDEYGPHIVHYAPDGRQLERVSPLNINTGGRKLPAVLQRRWANRGMEGLTVTPDQTKLVGIMQSRLYNPNNAGAINKNLTRIVVFDLLTGGIKQFIYKQEQDNNSNSEISALTDSTFLVIERDQNFSADFPNPSAVMKHVYKINIANATDVNGDPTSMDGMLVNNKTLEANTWAELTLAGIVPVQKTLSVDLVTALGDYPHDKMEGIWIINEQKIGIVNDDDFTIWSDPVNKIKQKTLSPSMPGNPLDGNTLYIVEYQ